jgi:hypothetical protein
VGRESAVGIATRYRLVGPKIESRCEQDLPHPSSHWDQPSILHNGYEVSFSVVRRLTHGVDHQPPASAEVKEKANLHFYSFSRPSWTVIQQTLSLLLLYQRLEKYSVQQLLRLLDR